MTAVSGVAKDPRDVLIAPVVSEKSYALLDRGATAVVCASDLMALGAIRAARERGLHVSDDFSVVGFDDSNLMAFLDPPLTTVRQPVQSMGSAAVQALADAIAGQPIPFKEYLFRPELVLRSSSGPVPR